MEKETVSIIQQGNQILLGMKKIRFGKRKYNGFGGSLENGETLEECVIRETLEEAGIIISPIKMGKILFHFENGEPNHLVYFFKATNFDGEPIASEEMKPKWFHIKKIPYKKMWPDDKYWLPLLLKGQKFMGEFYFNLDNEIKKYELNNVEELN